MGYSPVKNGIGDQGLQYFAGHTLTAQLTLFYPPQMRPGEVPFVIL